MNTSTTRLLTGVGLALTLGLGSAQAQQIAFGTMGQGTAGYSMGAAIAGVLSENGIRARVQPSAGTSAYLPLMETGELDFGIANIVETSEALSGTGGFEGHRHDNVRIASILFPFRVGMFVPEDSDIETLSDLRGKRVTHGYTTQRTIGRVVDALLANGGLTSDDIRPVRVPNVVRGADDLAAGRADAGFFAIGAGKVSEVDASVGGVRFLPVSEDPEAVERMQAVVPEAYVATVQPRSGMAGIAQPTPSMAYDYVLLVGAHVPADTVAEVVKILNANKDKLAASFGGFRGWDTNRMFVETDAPYHEGAEKALRELGQWKD
ncbi:MAG: TAXI family TRAP transporter solute-binding subunit [Aquisalimonadaceae bacterium]